jgi:hypothetical protein
MKSARIARTLEVIVLILLVVAHATAWWVIRHLGLNFGWTILTVVSLFVCQPVLVAAWMIAGPGAWWWRWPLCGLSLLAGAAYFWWSSDLSFEANLVTWVVVTVAIVAAGLILTRLSGIDLCRAPTQRAMPWHFTIRSLLIWTAVIAAGMQSARWIHGAMARINENKPNEPPTFALLGVCSALIAATAIWTTLPEGRIWWRWGPLALITAAAGALGPYLAGRTTVEWEFIIVGGVQAALLAGTLLVVRGCGYRLDKRRPAVWNELRRKLRRRRDATAIVGVPTAADVARCGRGT